MNINTNTFYIIRKANTPNSFLTNFYTEFETGTLKIEFGYVNNSQHFDTLTEA